VVVLIFPVLGVGGGRVAIEIAAFRRGGLLAMAHIAGHLRLTGGLGVIQSV